MGRKLTAEMFSDDLMLGPDHLVQPADLEVSSIGTCGFFGKFEVEKAAGDMVAFFQQRGEWGKFTLSELTDFYRATDRDPNKMLFGLMGTWVDSGGMGSFRTAPQYIVHSASGGLYLTGRFVRQCLAKPGLLNEINEIIAANSR